MNSSYGDTSGSDSRDSRQMMEPLMVFSLDEEVDRLHAEEQWTDGDRNSRMLAKDVDFRVLLSVLRDGARIDEQNGEARASIQLLRGSAVLRLGGGTTLGGAIPSGGNEAELAAGDLATINAGQPWELQAAGECALVLTLAWPREKAGV